MNAGPGALLGVSQALERLLAFFSPLPVEYVPLAQARGRVLGADLTAPFDLPPFTNSAMDGFALRSADVAAAGRHSPVRLQVVEDIPAGQLARCRLGAGQAARIMTGAVLPEGADCVVPVEDTDFNDRSAGVKAPAQVQVYTSPAPGDNLRPRGQDVRAGQLVLPRGARLRPQEVGFLGMLGMDQVPVHRRPRVAILSSGDEILPVEAPLEPGKIHVANSYTLAAAVESAGGESLNLGIVPDQAQAVRQRLDQALDLAADLILSSAGVSVGAFDFVRSVVESRGHLDFWRVNMRPGKPFAFGNYRGLPFFGLPGNPVSAFVGFEVFVRPALARLAGAHPDQRTRLQVHLGEPLTSDGRESYLRVVLRQQQGQLLAYLTGHQGSGNLLSLVQADALVIIPAGVTHLPAGATLEAWLFAA